MVFIDDGADPIDLCPSGPSEGPEEVWEFPDPNPSGGPLLELPAGPGSIPVSRYGDLTG